MDKWCECNGSECKNNEDGFCILSEIRIDLSGTCLMYHARA